MANVQTQVLSDDAPNYALLAEVLSDVGLDAGGEEVIETVPESDGLSQVCDIAASVEMLDDSLLGLLLAGQLQLHSRLLETFRWKRKAAVPIFPMP